jgi:integrase/recombinase XerD
VKKYTKTVRRFPVEVLTLSEVASLIKAASPTSSIGVRNRALLTTLYRTGLRISELLALKLKDLDLEAGTLTVLHGKGDRRRVVGLDAGAAAILGLWLERRTKLGLNGRHFVFSTLKGQPIATPYIRTLLPRLAKKAGIEKRVHAHGLRHTHAAELAREKMPLNLIQAQLGHSSLATTDRYLRHVAPEELVRVIKARSWQLPE